MKIIVGDKAYLQKFDLAFMLHEFTAVPGCIMMEAFSSACAITVNGGNDAVRFGFCFEEKETVDFIKECDWLMDFSEYSQKGLDELIALRDEMSDDLSREVDDFNGASVEYRKKNFEEYSEKFDHMKLKTMSLDMLVDCKKGKIKMPDIPDEDTVLEGNGFARVSNSEIDGIHIEIRKTSKKQGFFRRFFKRGAQ